MSFRAALTCMGLYNVVYVCDWVCTAVMSNDVMKDLRG